MITFDDIERLSISQFEDKKEKGGFRPQDLLDLDDAELGYFKKKVKKSTPVIKKSIKNSQLTLNPKQEKLNTIDLKP